MAHIFLNEDAYFKVLKAFASGKYDLKKEMLLAKLRRELLISDQRHGRMREMIEEGTQLRERDFDMGVALPREKRDLKQQTTKRQRDDDSSEGEPFTKAGSTKVPPISPFSNPHKSSKRPSSHQAAAPAKRQKKEVVVGTFAGGQVVSEINELIGYKVRRYWPENGGWFDGAITDYNPIKREHCITYDMNTHSESYEWYKMDNADEEEFQLLDEKINIIEHAPKGQPSLHKDPPKETGPGVGNARNRGLMNGRGRGRGERIMATGYNKPVSHEYASTAYRPPSAPDGAEQRVAFIAESDDSSSSDDSFSD